MKAQDKKKEMAKKIKPIGKPAYPQKGLSNGEHFFRKERHDIEKNSPL